MSDDQQAAREAAWRELHDWPLTDAMPAYRDAIAMFDAGWERGRGVRGEPWEQFGQQQRKALVLLTVVRESRLLNDAEIFEEYNFFDERLLRSVAIPGADEVEADLTLLGVDFIAKALGESRPASDVSPTSGDIGADVNRELTHKETEASLRQIIGELHADLDRRDAALRKVEEGCAEASLTSPPPWAEIFQLASSTARAALGAATPQSVEVGEKKPNTTTSVAAATPDERKD